MIHVSKLLTSYPISSVCKQNTILTCKTLENRIRSVFQHIKLGKDFYSIDNQLNQNELHSTKWKTYLYLRKCILDHRKGQSKQLEEVLNFLANSKNKKWLAKQLLDQSIQKSNEKWGSGNHEWLNRSLIIEVIKRSAGMYSHIKSNKMLKNPAVEIDWLYIQAMMRSPTKYIFFKNKKHTIETGHPGALKKNLFEYHFTTSGNFTFHQRLNTAFYQSKTINNYLKKVNNIFHKTIITGKTPLKASANPQYVVDGSSTANRRQINLFRKVYLKKQGYDPFNFLMSKLR